MTAEAYKARCEPDAHFPGKHPEWGGMNWGIQFSSHWGDYNVNHGQSGSHDTEPPRRFDGAEIPDDLPLWSCDQARMDDAQAVWDAREQINDALRERSIGTSTYRPTAPGGLLGLVLPTVVGMGLRIRVVVEPATFTISPYDHPTDFDPFTIERTPA